MSYHCGPCERSFSSKEGLKQHKRNSSSHNFKCEPCDRRYGSETALQQHLRDSRAHARSFDCNDCNRSFGTEEALQQHVRDSPAHTQSFDCNDCNISFGSEEELQQHQDSAVHTQSFDCNDRNRSFGSEEALEQHLRDFPNHQQNRETPLDAFFLSFPTFDYDPSLPPATSYNNLQRQQGWHHRSAESNEAWKEYQDALESELHLWYGEESDLTAWHSLCRAIGVEPLPNSCEQCEKVVRRMHVNIIDLIEWARSGSQQVVRSFRSLADLRVYTMETHKIFHNRLDHSNVVLRHLLRKIFGRTLTKVNPTFIS